MAPSSSIQGLNIVHEQQQPAQYPHGPDTLHLPQGFPELAQLELWSQLAFSSDEPAVSSSSPSTRILDDSPGRDEDDEDERSRDGRPAQPESHENAVTGTPVPPAPKQQKQQQPRPQEFDLGALLASFNADPFSVPGSGPAVNNQPTSLAQLLAFAPPPHPALSSVAPAVLSASSSSSASTSSIAPPAPATKRARTRKASVSSSSPVHEAASPITTAAADASGDDLAESVSQNFSATEDKRRRNTAASARFRLKKKEREAALEKRAKELELRVGELERECEGLRRENGWLKGLVVGVTGVGAQPIVQQPQQTQVTQGKRARED
jgi:hypothetical protein